jgi:hypothetical protein
MQDYCGYAGHVNRYSREREPVVLLCTKTNLAVHVVLHAINCPLNRQVHESSHKPATNYHASSHARPALDTERESILRNYVRSVL